MQPGQLSETWQMDRSRWYLLLIIVFLLGGAWTLLSRVSTAETTNGAPPPSPREGFSAPDFTLELLGGGEMSLSELRGQAVMINLWASWCPPCRAEMPAIERVYQDLKDEGLVVLAVNTTFQDSEAAAVEFVAEFGLTFPVLLDRTGAVSNRYQLRGLPSTYFVDREGVIRAVVVGGPMSEGLIRSKVQELLQEAP
ncbi:MAG: TlpA family protein disulfide reductase [Anaerolineae bacterium]|nr:MAG: TlpA family protein disulfide reductase [Anaerolineae bacterium]